MAFFQGRFLWVNQREDVAELRFGGPGEAGSLLAVAVLHELGEALGRIESAGSFRLLQVQLGKRGGTAMEGDLETMAALSVDDWQRLAQEGQNAARRLAGFTLPTVAMIGGACAGPDLQLALACDYRIALDRPGTLLAMPELELGLLPFWGATHRLPRLIGLEQAIKLFLTGRRLAPAEALSWGLVDEVSRNGSEPPGFLTTPVKRPRARLRKTTWRQWLVESHPPGRWLLFKGGRRLILRRFADDMLGPERTLEAMRQGIRHGADHAERLEREALGEVVQTPAWHNLLDVHRQRERIRADLLADAAADRIRQAGIVGVEGRGAALAVLAATHDTQVLLHERDETALGRAVLFILKLFEQETSRGALTPAEIKQNLNAIKAGTNYRDFRGVDAAILPGDASVEELAESLHALENKVGDQTMIVVTDPAFPVAEVASLVRRSNRLASVHFQTPAGPARLAEVVPARDMPADSVRRLMAWLAQLGRTPRRVPDGPGFLFNRLLIPYLLEAVSLVKEGIRTDLVDQTMRRFGMAYGPLEHLDLMGVDVVERLAGRLAEADGRLALDDTLAFLIERGWLGQRAGHGFYHYRGRRQRLHHRLMSELRERGRRERAEHLDILSKADQSRKVVERLVYLWINEAARCVEGYLCDADQLDLTIALGGWAPQRGGPLGYARSLGQEKVLAALDLLQQRHGERYRASPWLREIGGSGSGFQS